MLPFCMLFARQPAIKCCVVTWSVRFLCVASSHALFYFIKVLSSGGKDMDRESLVASLKNFGQSLARQRMLKESLDDLRKKKAEYERQCKLTEKPGTSNPPEESTYDYKRLSAYDEKHKPKERSKKYKEFCVSFCANLLRILIFILLAMGITAGIWLLIWKIANRNPLEPFTDSEARPIAIGIMVFIMCGVSYWLIATGKDGLFEYASFYDFFDGIFDRTYNNRLKRYFARHKAARLREYKIDLGENYEKSKKISDETKPKLEKTIALIENKRRELAEVNRAIAEYDILPEKYKYPHAVDSITEYIRDMRADSIKEAINLYVVESRERSRENIRRFEEERRLEEQRETSRRLIEEEERRRKAAEEISDTMKDIKNKLDN